MAGTDQMCQGGHMRRMRAFTLPEMLGVMLILGVMLGIGIPALADFSARTRANSAMFQLRGLLHLARSSAITLRSDVTLCGTVDGRSCSTQWEELPALAFLDDNLDRQLDEGERVILRSEHTRNARLRWRGSGGRAYLRYRPDGGVKDYGHFLYCPEDGDLRFARQLIISATGRPRHGLDSNGDGIIDDPNVAAPACSF